MPLRNLNVLSLAGDFYRVSASPAVDAPGSAVQYFPCCIQLHTRERFGNPRTVYARSFFLGLEVCWGLLLLRSWFCHDLSPVCPRATASVWGPPLVAPELMVDGPYPEQVKLKFDLIATIPHEYVVTLDVFSARNHKSHSSRCQTSESRKGSCNRTRMDRMSARGLLPSLRSLLLEGVMLEDDRGNMAGYLAQRVPDDCPVRRLWGT